MTTKAEIRKQKAESIERRPEGQSSEVGGLTREKLKAEMLKSETGPGTPVVFLTRHELAEALRISISLLDLMVRNGEMTCLRVRGNFVRFYLPHVIRDLEAASAVSKRRFTRTDEKRGARSGELGAK